MVNNQPHIGGQNEHYIGSRLSYSSALADADNSFGDYFLADILKLFLTITTIWFAVSFFLLLPGSFIIWLFAWIIGLNSLVEAFSIVFLVLYPALYIGLWLFPSREFAGRWELSFDGQAAIVEPAILLIFDKLRAKQVPAGASVRRQEHGTDEERFYIVLKRGEFNAYISVIPFGTDLYATWAMWRHRPPALAVIRYVSDLFRSLAGKGAVLPKISRNDPERALREAIHDAVRAGVEQALAGQTATVAGTFGSSVAIEEESGPTFVSLADPASGTTQTPPPPSSPPPPAAAVTPPSEPHDHS